LRNESLLNSTINNGTPIIRADGVLDFTVILVNICVMVSEKSKRPKVLNIIYQKYIIH